MSKGKPSGRKAKNPLRKKNIHKSLRFSKYLIPAIFLLGVLLYANTITHDYTQDDAIVIYDNMYTTRGVKGIPGLLGKDTFFGFFKVEGKAKLVSGGRYRPLTPVMFAVEWQLFGRRPWAGHLINILLYGLTGVVVFKLLQWIGEHSSLSSGRSGKQKSTFPGGRGLVFALIGTVLYIAHPLHTEVVANIKGRDEMMAFLLSIISLWVLLRALPKPDLKALCLSGLCLFLALMSKENAITFLAIIPLTLVLFGKVTWVRALRYTVPCLIAAGLFLVIRGQVIGWDFGDTPRELLNNPYIKVEGNKYVDFTPGERFATIMYTLGKYIQLLILPHPLTHDYYPRHVEVMRFSNWQSVLSLVFYLGLSVITLLGLRRKKMWAYGSVFFLITLSIVSNIVFPIGTNMSERFMYMPSLGFAIAMAALLMSIKRLEPKVIMGIVAIIGLLFAVKTIARNHVWKDNNTLFTTDIKTSKRSAKLLASVGGELVTRNGQLPQSVERDEKLRSALAYLTQAREIHPNYKLTYLLEGNAQFYLQDWEGAIKAYQNVLSLDPDHSDARRNLGLAYRDAGRFYGEKQNDLVKATRYLEEAIQILPEDYEAVHSLGVSYGISNRPQKAVEMFKRGVELAPENATAHFNLGLAYQRVGDAQNAQLSYDHAIQLDPEIAKRRGQQN